MDKDTKIRMLNALILETRFNIQKIETLAKSFGLNSAFVNKSNWVQIPLTIVSYKQESVITALLDTGATENFFDDNAATYLHLGRRELENKWPIYNIDRMLNQHGIITQYCNLLISKGNVKWQQRFYITNLGRDCFLLGYPWFKAFNVTLTGKMDYSKDQKSRLKPSKKLYGTKPKPISRINSRKTRTMTSFMKPMRLPQKN